jgi:hypothetical protein
LYLFFLTFGVNILRIEINPAVPLNRIEGDMDPLEPVQILDALEYAEIKERLHVKDAILAVFEDQKEGVVVPGNHFFNSQVHRVLLSALKMSLVGRVLRAKDGA